MTWILLCWMTGAATSGCVPANLGTKMGIGATMSDETAVREALGKEAPAEARVRSYSGTPAAGVRVYTVEGGTRVPIGVAVMDDAGQKRVLRGPDAFRTLVARVGSTNARQLAEWAVQFVEPGSAGGKVIPTSGAAPELTAAQAALVAPPAVEAGVLTYWRWPPSVLEEGSHTAPEPARCTLVLESLALQCG